MNTKVMDMTRNINEEQCAYKLLKNRGFAFAPRFHTYVTRNVWLLLRFPDCDI